MMFQFAGHSDKPQRVLSPWLTKEIIFVCTVFLTFTLRMTCERTFIFAQFTLELHHRICNLRYGTHGYGMNAYEITAKFKRFNAL